MIKSIHEKLIENKKLLKHHDINLNYLRAIIMGDNSTLIICLEEYLKTQYNSTLKLFMMRYSNHESLAKLCLEMKAKEFGLISPEIKSFNI